MKATKRKALIILALIQKNIPSTPTSTQTHGVPISGLLHSPLWREAPRRSRQQDGGERLSRVPVHSAYGRAWESTDALGHHPGHASVVGVVDVGVRARWRVWGGGESGWVHELLMGRALAFTGRTLLADVQGTLSSEGLWEGPTTITLVVVVDVVAEQPTRPLWGQRKERGGKGGGVH